MLKSLSYKKGFTLIELLVVIAIIGILSAITLAALQIATRNSYYSKAQADLNTMQLALELYYSDHGDWPPAGSATYTNTTADGQWDVFMSYMQPYLSASQYSGFDSVGNANEVSQGYSYSKGTSSNPLKVRITNGATNAYVGCITIRDGYYLDFLMPGQTKGTINDQGIDPDGFDLMRGDYTVDTVSC